jgi:superfamily II DNA or RNA helicase
MNDEGIGISIPNAKYRDFLAKKKIVDIPTGLKTIPDLNPMLFDFQHDIVRWALKRGRAAIFADCGMGKTPMQLEWAHHIPGNVLIVAPLAVSAQTIREAAKFHEEAIEYSPDGSINSRVTITNYERIEHFNPDDFTGIVLDESSILKSYTGKYRTELIERFGKVQYRLACTATPAPNDFMELGNHAEFLGAMKRTEMLSMFFVHDGGDTQQWRVKGHAETEFWKWICSWAVMIRKPSDLGYDDGAFILPELRMNQITVHTEKPTEGMLFPLEAQTLQERQGARRASIEDRVVACAEKVNALTDQSIVWCDLNDESHALAKSISGAVEVEGADTEEHKEKSLLDFAAGKIKVLVTKPRIAGFGMNFQSCHNVFFVGLSDSYEQFYQAVRRCWRFGQTKPVDCYVVTSDIEGAVVKNIERKEQDAKRMAEMMVENMHEINSENIRGIERTRSEYREDVEHGKNWKVYLGDCVDTVAKMPNESVHFSIFSPPFASLFTYSNSDRDMGNSKDEGEFAIHFQFLVKELYRVLKPGRLVSFHCMNIPMMLSKNGYIGLKDFRGDLIRAFESEGFIFHSEVTIWKDPVTEMQRTKAIGLLHKQVVKDSCRVRQGVPDYLVTMRKLGINPEPVEGELDHFCGEEGTFQSTGRLSIDIWQRYASPVWMDINQSDTLQKDSARNEKDERHICPLQLQVIHRALQLWTNPNDIVLSPFAGIGSEGYESIKLGRRFVGVELKPEYWRQAVDNLKLIEREVTTGMLDL